MKGFVTITTHVDFCFFSFFCSKEQMIKLNFNNFNFCSKDIKLYIISQFFSDINFKNEMKNI